MTVQYRTDYYRIISILSQIFVILIMLVLQSIQLLQK
nr:MAG TPA_asm: hypothetical protein [Bacteriophage sp.]